MKSDIQEKLQREIDAGISKESQVVYFLAGVRKMLEQDGDPPKFAYLKFHCDWALHAKLRGTPAQNVLKILDPTYSALLKRESIPDWSDASKLSKMELFEEQLSQFLSEQSLTDFTKVLNHWVRFIFNYSRVIEDCPLEIRSDNPIGIKSVVVRVSESAKLIEDHKVFRIDWNFEGKDTPSATYFIINSYSVIE